MGIGVNTVLGRVSGVGRCWIRDGGDGSSGGFTAIYRICVSETARALLRRCSSARGANERVGRDRVVGRTFNRESRSIDGSRRHQGRNPGDKVVRRRVVGA